MWKVDRTFLFFCGLNLEQVLGRGYRKCRRSTALFFLSELGTGASLQKMWRENRTFFFLRSEPGTGARLQKM